MIVEGRVVSLVQVCESACLMTIIPTIMTELRNSVNRLTTLVVSGADHGAIERAQIDVLAMLHSAVQKKKKRECTRPVFKKGERQEVASNYGKPPRLAVDHGNTNCITI